MTVVGLSGDDSAKILKVRIGEHDHQVGFQRIEIEGLETPWLVSREDLESIFGRALKPHYAPLLAELANEKYVASGAALDLDELDKLVACGHSFKDGIPSAWGSAMLAGDSIEHSPIPNIHRGVPSQ